MINKGLIKRIGIASLIATPLLLGACESRPTVYSYPTNPNTTFSQVERDRIDCENWARSQYGTSQEQQATQHGGGGALAGALLGGLLGGNWRSAGLGAIAGGGAGAAYGAGKGHQNLNSAYTACMSAKGYVVR